MRLDDMLRDIQAELNRAREKFPKNNHMMNALTEEVGELAQALLELNQERDKGRTCADVYKEAVQVAVMAIRVATEGDDTFPRYDPDLVPINAMGEPVQTKVGQLLAQILKPGDKVFYRPSHFGEGEFENGMVKEVFLSNLENEYRVRVVYHCNNDWEAFRDYTAATTDPDDLYLGWL